METQPVARGVRRFPLVNSGEVEEKKFGFFAGGQAQGGFVTYGGAIAGGQQMTIEIDASSGNLNPRMTAGGQIVIEGLPRLQYAHK